MAKGQKTGGRSKGTPNKTTQAAKELAIRAAAAGVSPLEFMLGLMRDDTADAHARLDAAKAAAPYIHPRLSSIEMVAHVTNHEAALDELE